MRPALKYNRVLIKLSGEAFGSSKKSIDAIKLAAITRELMSIHKLGCQVAVVAGGGNIWRKREQGRGMDEVTADYMGMVATVMNGLALKKVLERGGLKAQIQSYLGASAPGIEPVNAKRAMAAMAKGQVVLFVSGTGKPFVTTDTAAAMHGASVMADAVIKVGPADGVYTADPNKVKSARKFVSLTVREALRRNLGFMDKKALQICARHKVSIIVCRFRKGALSSVVAGKSVGTEVRA